MLTNNHYSGTIIASRDRQPANRRKETSMKTYIFGIVYFSNGTSKASRDFVNADAFSRWVNAQFIKDEGATVEEYNYQRGILNYKLVCTWHA